MLDPPCRVERRPGRVLDRLGFRYRLIACIASDRPHVAADLHQGVAIMHSIEPGPHRAMRGGRKRSAYLQRGELAAGEKGEQSALVRDSCGALPVHAGITK